MIYPGTPTLNRIAKEEAENFTDEEFIAYRKNYNSVLKTIRSNNDWLIPFICQYDDRYPEPTFEETIWMANIKAMILSNNLFLALVGTKNWANPDKYKKENFEILEDAGFIIEETKGYADAEFMTPECGITLAQVYQNDFNMPEKKFIPTKHFVGSGYVEFGTQSISKTAFYLQSNTALVRLPYDPNIKGLKPCAAILMNYRKLENIISF
jgi:hypothetical protein